MTLTIGLMSGTSLDGVDGVLLDRSQGAMNVRAHQHRAFGPALRSELLALNRPGDNELHRAALAANALVEVGAQVTAALLHDAGVAASDVLAIGSHGQTLRHRPQAFDGIGYTLQIDNGALLAERTGIDVVCDFRSSDVAAGGQGAPLVPAFHCALFGPADHDRAVLNLGGIANLTLLPRAGEVRGFDCGPGNMLLDAWCQQHCGLPFDDGGAWAASGQVLGPLLGVLLAEPFFAAVPPKSTGRDLFDAQWLARALTAAGGTLAAQDVQATLSELSARAVVDALNLHAPDVSELILCGGGCRNADLVARLQRLAPRLSIGDSSRFGVAPDQVEAAAFAWLASAYLESNAGNRVGVTGARGPRVLGALYRRPPDSR